MLSASRIVFAAWGMIGSSTSVGRRRLPSVAEVIVANFWAIALRPSRAQALKCLANSARLIFLRPFSNVWPTRISTAACSAWPGGEVWVSILSAAAGSAVCWAVWSVVNSVRNALMSMGRGPRVRGEEVHHGGTESTEAMLPALCLLYTSDAADDLLCVDLGGRRIIKKK